MPKTKSWAELGLDTGAPETSVQRPPGSETFAKLKPSEQATILGPAKYQAYKDGRITLDDLRGFRNDPRWGPTGYERSLQDALGGRGS